MLHARSRPRNRYWLSDCASARRAALSGLRRVYFGAELLLQRLDHAREGAIDQRLGFDQPRAIGAEALRELVRGERYRLLTLPVGEQIRAAQRAHPRELGKRELAIFAFEFHPHASLEPRGAVGQAILHD